MSREPCDIVLVSGGSFLSRLIKTGEWIHDYQGPKQYEDILSMFKGMDRLPSHVGITLANPNLMAESLWRVSITPVDDYARALDKGEIEGYEIRRVPNLALWQISAILSVVELLIGAKYDWLGIVGEALTDVTGMEFWDQVVQDPETVYCSGLVHYCFGQAKINIDIKQRTTWGVGVSPVDIWEWLRRNDCPVVESAGKIMF